MSLYDEMETPKVAAGAPAAVSDASVFDGLGPGERLFLKIVADECCKQQDSMQVWISDQGQISWTVTADATVPPTMVRPVARIAAGLQGQGRIMLQQLQGQPDDLVQGEQGKRPRHLRTPSAHTGHTADTTTGAHSLAQSHGNAVA